MVSAIFYPHQVEAIERVRAHLVEHRAFLLADSTGLGKSRVACEVAKGFQRILVVAPLSTFGGWLLESATVGWDLRPWGCEGASAVLVNYEQLAKVVDNYDLVIFDESQRLKSHRAKRHKLFLKLRQNCAKMLFLSATPAQSPLEMKYLGDVFGFKQEDFWLWVMSWKGLFRNRWNGFDYRHSAEDDRRLSALMTGPHSLRRRASEIAGWPELRRIVVPVALSGRETAEYDAAWQDYSRAVPARGGRISNKVAALIAIGQFRKRLSALKVKACYDFAQVHLEQGKVVVISTEYLDPAHRLHELLSKYKVAIITGESTDAHRRMVLAASARDEYDVVITTCTEGINLHQVQDAHRERVHICHDVRWSALQQHQLEGRVHRAGRSAVVFWLTCGGTVDDRVARKLAGRMATMRTICGDDIDDILEAEIGVGQQGELFSKI